jgi:hypothetical protein
MHENELLKSVNVGEQLLASLSGVGYLMWLVFDWVELS